MTEVRRWVTEVRRWVPEVRRSMPEVRRSVTELRRRRFAASGNRRGRRPIYYVFSAAGREARFSAVKTS